MTDLALMQQALDALTLKKWWRVGLGEPKDPKLEAAITAIKQVLAAPVQPVASDGWLQSGGLLYRLTDGRKPQNRDEINVTMAEGSRSVDSITRRAGELLDRIRATPPAAQRKPLTSEAIRAAGGIVHKDGNVFFTNLDQLHRAIEAAHGIKEKNT
jgi:hypothetical protein